MILFEGIQESFFLVLYFLLFLFFFFPFLYLFFFSFFLSYPFPSLLKKKKMWGARTVGCLALRRGLVREGNNPSFLLSRTPTLLGGARFSSASPVQYDQRKKKKQKQHKLFEGKQRLSTKMQRCLGYRTAEEYDFSRVQGLLSSHQMSLTILEGFFFFSLKKCLSFYILYLFAYPFFLFSLPFFLSFFLSFFFSFSF